MSRRSRPGCSGSGFRRTGCRRGQGSLIVDNRILIVDDKPEVRDSMSEYMRLAGFVAESVASAEDALDLLRNSLFDLVITDIVLPGLGGLELTQLVKKRHNTDVVVMTGYSDNFSYEGAISIGASDFVVK